MTGDESVGGPGGGAHGSNGDNVVVFRRPAGRRGTGRRAPRTPRPGTDFVYSTYGDSRRPLRWDPTRRIVVRPGGDIGEATRRTLTDVVDETAAISGLSLSLGEPSATGRAEAGPSTDPAGSPERTITVSVVELDGLARVCGLHPAVIGGLCNGHTVTETDPSRQFYTGASISLLAAASGAAVTARTLMHHLGHALGLGHCRSPERLMHRTPSTSVLTWTDAEAHALRSLRLGPSGGDKPTPMCIL